MNKIESLKYITTFQCDNPAFCGNGAICNSCWVRGFAEDMLKQITSHSTWGKLKRIVRFLNN